MFGVCNCLIHDFQLLTNSSLDLSYDYPHFISATLGRFQSPREFNGPVHSNYAAAHGPTERVKVKFKSGSTVNNKLDGKGCVEAHTPKFTVTKDLHLSAELRPVSSLSLRW